ncbi:hypothetical protein VV869_05210 [Photobacterium sp. MCCC 1A19761]|uniref:hypothetical protein n=1 Tax=Photobacterium sp. MCCC 1A19761 TaxID=3115000 RepID=UPI00307E0FFF
MKIILLLAMLIMSGCSSLPVSKSVPKLKVEYVEGVSETTGEIKVGIVRNNTFLSAGIHYWPVYGRQAIAGILIGDYIEFYLSKKGRSFGVACHGGWSSSWKIRNYEINNETPNEIYFLISPSVTEGDQCVDMEKIDKEEFLGWKASSKRVNVGEVSMR